jgi:hypothetical protein
MTPRRKVGRRDAQLSFEALEIEGGLLSPEWLARIAQLEAVQQSPADYRIPKGLNLRDEIGRYWRIAQAHWGELAAGTRGGADPAALGQRFSVALLRDSFGFATLAKVDPLEIAGRSYPIGHQALGGRVPVVIAPAGTGVEAPASAFGDEGRKRSAFGLAQEFLNAEEKAVWGIATDGLTLRVLRDNASLTRPAWIQADLARIFAEERYADFAALWLLAHETRFGAGDHAPADCPLEVWRNAGLEEGTAARDKLRDGVQHALEELGAGFLRHPENQALRSALHAGKLTKDAFFQELLRLVYRLIFLLTAEERGVLHPTDAPEPARKLYADGYGMRRLRDRAVKRSAHDRFADLWEGVKIVLRGVARGQPRLALPALGGLFDADQCPHLDVARLENRALLTAVFKLAWLVEPTGLSRVNWRDMGPEELGSVYESLLELVPVIPEDERGFSFATGAETKGNERKKTGSYYTPDSLVQVLLDSALEPVVEQTMAANPGNAAEALLQLAIVDPACGSGHFLLAAADRVAGHVARLQAEGTPSGVEYRHALRQVVSRCLFGVDLNPMAVELCRVALWMKAVEPGRPLSFLDSHIQRGNALLGATPELMEKGVPDAAWEPIEGDDKKTASLLKKKNKAAAEGQRGMESLWSKPASDEPAEVAKAVAELEAAPDADLAAVESKEVRWQKLQASEAFRHQKFIADAWCAAFVWPKPATEPKKVAPIVAAAPTNDLWRQIRDDQGTPPALMVQTIDELAAQYQFFHWHLAFPQVFARGGFDVVLGNPPWEKVKLLEQEFFASRCGAIAMAANAAQRKKLIAALPETDPVLWNEWCAASRAAEGQSHIVRDSGRYPLCGRGDVNMYAVFAEHNVTVLGSAGRTGFISPTGIATDDTTKAYFQSVVDRHLLRSLFDFQSGPGLFGEIGHGTFKFSLVTVSAEGDPRPALLSFYARSVADALSDAKEFSLSAEDIRTLNPNTRTCPTFRSRRDAEVNLHIYRRTGVLWREGDEECNPWSLQFLTMFHMTNDAGLFRASGEAQGTKSPGFTVRPLVEAKMVHHFDHRYGDYRDQPADSENSSLPDVPLSRLLDPAYSPHGRYWVAHEECERRLHGWRRGWLLGWRDISKTQNERTCVASIIPRCAVGNNFPLALVDADPKLVACLYANLCAFAFDYAVRQKAGGTHLNFFIFKQLPVAPPSTYRKALPWHRDVPAVDWIVPRVVELTYTAWNLEPFAQDVAHVGPPFRWDPERRFMLRAELDAAFFHLYGIGRDDADYILETFPIVKKNDVKAHGVYRTKRAILEIYDAMAEATRAGQPYLTRLDPPPADPRLAHPPRAPVRAAKPPKVAVLPDAAWQRPRTDHAAEIGVVLAALLKAFGRPTPVDHVRLAAVLALHPALALASVKGKEAAEWRRLVGEEAEPLPPGVAVIASRTDREWGEAVRHLRGTRLLVEDARAQTWAPGAGLAAAIDTDGWADGRARWVVEMIERRGAEDVLQTQRPEIRRWVSGAEAA